MGSKLSIQGRKNAVVYCEYIFLFRAEKLHVQFLERVLTLSGPKLLVKRDKTGDEKIKSNKWKNLFLWM